MATSKEILGHFKKESLSNLKKLRSFLLPLNASTHESYTSNRNLLISLIITLALAKNIPLFHKYFPLKNISFALFPLGFSVNLLIAKQIFFTSL